MRRALALLELLADGAMHSGADLARQLGVTRGAVWQQVALLREQGVSIRGGRGRGYLLEHGFEALDATRIRAALAARGVDAWTRVDVVDITDSTNERLLHALAQGEDIHGRALLAEHQTAGRGRRGDKWLSPPGSGVCLSIGWRFDAPPATFSALSLVVGVAIADALREQGVAAARLKWPNDILCAHGKAAGILIEMRAEAGGACHSVIGIGINLRLSPQARAMIDQPADDLSAAGLSRNQLAAELLAALAHCLPRFGVAGFAPFRARWSALDALADQAVRVVQSGREIRGVARGVDAHGALLIEHDGRREAVVSGHVERT